MKAIGLIGPACFALAISCPVQAGAQTSGGSVEPDALAAMDKMSAALRAMPAISFEADVTMEEVLETGQKLQFGGTVELAAHKPNAFKIVAEADGVAREFYYDGKSLTVYAPILKYYATFPAPSSIGATLEKARANYGIELPLADLFTWDTDQTIRARIKSGYSLRPETIAGKSCFHYAFRQEKVDWQIWIDEGEKALPCKLVITNTDDPSMPQYSAVFHWDTDARPAASEFAFSPPSGAHQISMEEASAAKKQGETK